MEEFLDYIGLNVLMEWIKTTFAQKESVKAGKLKRNNTEIGTVLTPTGADINLAVPVKTSDLANDAGYQTAAEVQAAISSIKKIRTEVVDSLPSAGEADILYLVANGESGNNSRDEYMWINGSWEKIGTTASAVEVKAISESKIRALFD